ncbi:activating signal cointegrator 1 complex subunit 1 [Vanessa cardui]|uniref:activating signal cointegrator 1 complex subunit 1 n=1 Tax=Vanessa cardui TaxID=171605 RepID=UPI001F148A7A|nr:activating signal cointegrator 1 complex subunit 1 [Vanessa cardui]
MNDILRPELIWIEGRCYRVNDPITNVTAFQEQDLYETELPYNEIDDEDEDDDDDLAEITQVDNGRYFTSFHISKHYLGSIIGKKGATVSRIKRDTRTDIKIPRHGENKEISIYGPNVSSVKAAKRRINIIVISSRMKQKSTHFISIPMNFPNIIKQFENFKECVLRECEGKGLEESLFIRGEKLHLTVGVMCLMDNEERLAASKLLTEAREKCIMPLLNEYQPLQIRLKGLSYMNDDPKEIDVLYGCVEEVNAPSGLLQRVVDSIVSHFYKAGFMDKEYGRDNVKLHVTLLNSKYKSRDKGMDEETVSNQINKRETFDGSQILSKFSDYDFGIVELNNIHLSLRKSMGPDGYYQSTCVISCKI